MPAILSPAAQRINADTAGLTHVVSPSEVPGQPVGFVPGETAHEIVPTELGGLHHLFTDGLGLPSPEQVVETAVTKPTDSIVGRLGGLVPRHTTPQEPGPTTGNPHRTEGGPGMAFEPAPTKATVGTYAARARKWLGF